MMLLSYLVMLLGFSLTCRAVPAPSKHELAEEEELILVGREAAIHANRIARQMDDVDSTGVCGPPPEIEHGTVALSVNPIASVATYNCNAGHSLEGNSVITCDTSAWSLDKIPMCKIADCGAPAKPNDGHVKFENTTFESKATYSCDPGFHLKGVAGVVCQEDGQWSGMAKCELGNCSAPPNVYGASFEVSTVTVGSSVTYQCDEGHIMHGEAMVHCNDSMQWSAAPSCKMVDCGAPPPIEDGQVIVPITTYDAKATYQCNPGCIQIGEENILQCQLDGHWSGSPPSCLNPIEWTEEKFDNWFPLLIDVDFHVAVVEDMIFAIYNLTYEIMKFQGMDDHIGCIDFVHMLLAIPRTLRDVKSKELAKDFHEILGTYILRNPVSLKDARALKMQIPTIIEKFYEPVAEAVKSVKKILDEKVAGFRIEHTAEKVMWYLRGILEAGKAVKAKDVVMYLVKAIVEVQNLIEVHLKQNSIIFNCEHLMKDLDAEVFAISSSVTSALKNDKITAMIHGVTDLHPALCEVSIDPFVEDFLQNGKISHYTSAFERMQMMYNLVTSPNANTLVSHWNVLQYLIDMPFKEVQKVFRSINKVVPLQALIESSGVRFSTSIRDIPESFMVELSSAIFPDWRYHNGKPETACERITDGLSVFLGIFELKRFNYTLEGMFAEYSKEFFADLMKKYPKLDSRLKDKVQCKVDHVLSEVYVNKMEPLVKRLKKVIDTRPYEKLSYNMATLISEHRPTDLGELLFEISQTLDIYSDDTNSACDVSEDLISELHAMVSGWTNLNPTSFNQIVKGQVTKVLNVSIESETGMISIDAKDEELKRSIASSLGQLMSKTVMHLKNEIEHELLKNDLDSLEMYIAKEITLLIHDGVMKMESAVAHIPML